MFSLRDVPDGAVVVSSWDGRSWFALGVLVVSWFVLGRVLGGGR